jgi:hypothetical protein
MLGTKYAYVKVLSRPVEYRSGFQQLPGSVSLWAEPMCSEGWQGAGAQMPRHFPLIEPDPVDVRTQNDLFGEVRLMIAAESSPAQITAAR